ncbi:MAG TPA: hypothetical protein VF329_00050 [Gammaproteobacteria bacterium]
MTESTGIFLTSGLGALLFCAAFLFGDKIRPLRAVIHDPRSIASFGAGVSTAYVFVHLMPELAEAREAVASSASRTLRYEGMVIYVVALTGFLAFYGLLHFRKRVRAKSAEGGEAAFRVDMAGWGCYVAIAAYLLSHTLDGTTASTLTYAVAIAFHLVAADHAFRREHGAAYAGKGRLVLAAAALAGWLLGVLVALPLTVTAAAVAFVSGAVIINSAVMELPAEKDGRFFAFAIGSAAYTVILTPL